jgi:hypothetical protein
VRHVAVILALPIRRRPWGAVVWRDDGRRLHPRHPRPLGVRRAGAGAGHAHAHAGLAGRIPEGSGLGRGAVWIRLAHGGMGMGLRMRGIGPRRHGLRGVRPVCQRSIAVVLLLPPLRLGGPAPHVLGAAEVSGQPRLVGMMGFRMAGSLPPNTAGLDLTLAVAIAGHLVRRPNILNRKRRAQHHATRANVKHAIICTSFEDNDVQPKASWS